MKSKIEDKGFIDLVYKIIRAGYIDEKGIFYNTKVGVPQGSIISPLLANIVLGKVDKFLEEICLEYTIGKNAKMNPEYSRLSDRIRSSESLSERRAFDKMRNNIRRSIPNDSGYKRVKFIRYADDILIGVIGSREDCNNIRERLNTFLKGLGLTLSLEKSKITYSEDNAKFLGYDIKITSLKRRPTISKHFSYKIIRSKSRTRPIINAPTLTVIKKLEELGVCSKGQLGIPKFVGRLIHEEHRSIILYFKSIGNGIFNYYRLATNFKPFRNRLAFILWYSCVLTLAKKFKLRTKRQTIKKLGTNLACYKIDKKGKEVIDQVFGKDYFLHINHIKEHKDFKDKFNKFFMPLDLEEIINKYKYMLPRSVKNLERPCQVCNSTDNVEMHHVKHLKNISGINDYLKVRQIKINRKQIPLCRNCHVKVHSGKYNGPGL